MDRDISTIKLLLKGETEFKFNPLLWSTEADLWIMGCIYQGIMMFDENIEITNRLTEEVTFNSNSTICELLLKKDLCWADGAPISSYDIDFTIKVLLDPLTNMNRGNHFLNIVGAKEYKRGSANTITGIEIINDKKMKFNFIKPDESFKRRLLLPIIPKHIFKDISLNNFSTKVNEHYLVGCGPYKLDKFTKNNFYFTRNQSFHLGKPKIKNMEIELDNSGDFIKKIKNKEVDFSVISYDIAHQLEKETEDFYTFYKLPKPQINIIALNHRNEILKMKAFRKTLIKCIDRVRILNDVYRGYGELINQYYPPLLMNYIEDNNNNRIYDYNPEGVLDSLKELDVKHVELKLGLSFENEEHLLTAKIIKENLDKVGINVKLVNCEKKNWKNHFIKEDIDMYLVNYLVFLDPDPKMFLGKNSTFISAINWNDDKNFNLINKGTEDKNNRLNHYKEWSSFIKEELPFIPLLSPYDIQIISKRFKGLKPDPRGVLWNIHELEFI